MAYEKTIWKNREVERPRTFKKVENPDGTITLVPVEGQIIEPGTPIIAENMNNIEQGIEDVHSDLETHKADYIHHVGYGADRGSANVRYIELNPAPTAYKEGMTVAFKSILDNTGAVTINVNGLGAKSVLKSNGKALSSGNLKSGSIYTIRYNGSNFILQGEGGEYGTAQAQDVISGKTIGTEEGVKNGTMPNNGSINKIITTQNGQIYIPKGYHNGSGYVKAQITNLIAENIKKGVNVGGVVGTFGGSFYHTTYQPTTLRKYFLIFDYQNDKGTMRETELFLEINEDLGFTPKFILAYNNKAQPHGVFPGSYVIYNSYRSLAKPTHNEDGYDFNILYDYSFPHFCVVNREGARVSQHNICLPLPTYANDSEWDVYIFG